MKHSDNKNRQQGGLFKIFFLGITLGFLQVSLFRELSQRHPICFFSSHFFIFGFTGLAAGAFYWRKPYLYIKKHPYWLLAFIGLFLLGIWVYRQDSIFFWTLSLYYPMPIPKFGWVKAVAFLAALSALPILFFLVASVFMETLETNKNLRTAFSLFMLGMSVGSLAGYPAQFLGAEVMLLFCCMTLLVFVTRHRWVLLSGVVIAGAIVFYGHWKTNYPILLSLRDYHPVKGGITDNYKYDFYAFRKDSCVALAINEFMHVYTCRNYEDLPVELSYLNRVLAEGLEDYRVLIVGCAFGLFPYQLYRANPSMDRCVLVDVDRRLAQTYKEAQETIGLDLYKDSRFIIKAYDPRYYLDHESGLYDLLYLHRIGNCLIFYPFTLVPIEYRLLTEESEQQIFHKLLKKDGVYIQDWGIPNEWEVRQYVGSFPKDVYFRAFWTTLSNNPLSGAPLVFVLASRSKERLNSIAGRLQQATYFHEVRQKEWSGGYRITDDRPWLKKELVIILLLALLPFLVPLYILYKKSGRLEMHASWRPRGPGRRYYLIFGSIFSLFTAFAMGRVTRLFPLGVNPGWLLVQAGLLFGFALGIGMKSFLDLFPEGKKALFPLLTVLCGADVYLLDTLGNFYVALIVLVFHGFLLGQVFGHGLARVSPTQGQYLYAFERMGAAFGMALFQVLAFFIGFRMTGMVSALLVFVAGLALTREIGRPIDGHSDGSTAPFKA